VAAFVLQMDSCTTESGVHCASPTSPTFFFNVYIQTNYRNIHVQDASSTNCEIGLVGDFWKPCSAFLKVKGVLERNRSVGSDDISQRVGEAVCLSRRKPDAAYQTHCPGGHEIC
jgi:hypothetical protein